MTAHLTPHTDATELDDMTGLLDRAKALRSRIRDAADTIEAAGTLPADLVADLAEAGVFKMFVPHELGGEQADPVMALDVVEELSYADASTGWCVMVGAQLGFLACYLGPEGGREVYSDPYGVVAGVGSASGRAQRVPGGYVVDGLWRFASGCTYATWLHGTTMVESNGEADAPGDAGVERRMMFFRAADCEILPGWDVTGLRGTGSHDFRVTGVFVPEARSYRVLERSQTRSFYKAPLFRFKIVNYILHGAHALGVGRRACEALIDLASSKQPLGKGPLLRERSSVQEQIADADALVGSARAYLRELTAQAWRIVGAGEVLDEPRIARLWIAMAHAVSASAKAVDLVFDAAGTTAILASSPFDRCFRDIHTAARHLNAQAGMKASAARALLGMPIGLSYF
jgi:alkylation response protein AidB-like acyl-CoA dehydrogenase